MCTPSWDQTPVLLQNEFVSDKPQYKNPACLSMAVCLIHALTIRISPYNIRKPVVMPFFDAACRGGYQMPFF